MGTVIHIMTNLNPLVEATLKYFTHDNLKHTRPQACGSYIVLPDDNSTLSKECNTLGGNGTHADGKWTLFSTMEQSRIGKPIHRDDYLSYSAPKRRNCDDADTDGDSLSPGDTWAVFVR